MSGRIACTIVLVALSAGAAAQRPGADAAKLYPERPVRFILPFAPGGPTSLLGRMVGDRLADALGQPVVMDNRAGAGGNVGAELAAKAPPDGHTLVLAATSIAISPSLYRKLAYDPAKDFSPVSLIANVPLVMITYPSLPAQTLKEFIALAKAKPGTLNFGSGGAGTSVHLAGEMFRMVTGTTLVHVPYKGQNLAMNDVIGGQVQLLFMGIAVPAPHVKTGRLRALAVVAAERSSLLPEVPTAAEAGLPGFDVSTWYGVLGPAGVPQPIVAKLNRELGRIMQSPDIRERLGVLTITPMTSTPEAFGQYVRDEIAKWGKVVRAAGLKPE